MSQQVIVNRDLEFAGSAAVNTNVKGDMLPERMTSIDWFDGTTLDATNAYTVTVGGTNDAISLVAGGENGVLFRTGDSDNEICFMANGLAFDITQSPAIETKMEVTDISGSVFFFGFSDATSETTPACTIDAAGGTVTAVATDAVGFLMDADLASSALYCVSVNNGGTAQSAAAAPAYVWTDGASKRLRVALDTSGNARFYLDGIQVGYIALAVADVPLCAIYNAGNREAATNNLYARYLAKFQDIP